MSQLIRFEDKYGMGDIVSLAQDLGAVRHNDERIVSETDKTDVFIQIGLSIGAVFSTDDVQKSINNDKRIDEVIFVYDMDSISGKGLLTAEQLEKTTERHNKFFSGINTRYAPIVWSAETIALYTMLDVYDPNFIVKKKCIDITTIVHQKNTAKLHGIILENVLKKNNVQYNQVKHMNDYIRDKKELIERIEMIIDSYPAGINKQTLQWMITGDTNYLYSRDKAIEHQDEVTNLYQNNFPQSGKIFNCYGKALKLDKKCW